MIRPMAAAMPPKVIRLKVSLVPSITTTVARTETGITTMAVNTLPQFLRNR